jgi:hypothetical protein
MTGMPSLEEVDARLRSLGANAVVTAEDARAIAHLDVLRMPAVSPVASRAERGRLSRRRLGFVRIKKWPLGWLVFVLLTLVVLLALGAVVVAADTQRAASEPSKPISEQEAIADAMRQLPNNGAGYKVVATQLEPSSQHFDFLGPNGERVGEDQVKECLVIPPLPPLPFLTPCRYYPVWVVALSSQTCNVDIEINALTGRFGGGGGGSAPSTSGASGSCEISPSGEATAPIWWQPFWN